MSDRKQEIANLERKVTQLYDVIKKMAEYMGWNEIETLLSSDTDLSDNTPQKEKFAHLQIVNNSHYTTNNHKDILIDDTYIHAELSNYSQTDNNISCEEQVHRLTAQLTAAYHRIASLEDQLLAIRNPGETSRKGFYHAQ